MSALSHFVAETQVITSPVDRVNRIPDGTTTLMFRLLGDERADLHVVGPRTQAVYKRGSPFEAVLRVVFRPGGGYPFFGVPLVELADRVVPLRDLWGAHADDLLEQLVNLNSNTERLAKIERALVGKLAAPQVHEPAGVPAVREALAQLSAEAATLREVARRLNVSERNLRRAFSAVVGLSPKRYARIARFQRAVARAALGSPRWSEIAAESGYFDQAHMCAEFRALARTTPVAFLRTDAIESHRQNCSQ